MDIKSKIWIEDIFIAAKLEEKKKKKSNFEKKNFSFKCKKNVYINKR